jgi:iron(III) transport system substrate-binding protein
MTRGRSAAVIAGLSGFLLLMPALSRSQTPRDSKLAEAANKEGELVHYTTMTLEQSTQLVDRFRMKYPGIKVNTFRTGRGPLLNKILTEAQARRHAWDVAVGGGEMVLPLKARKLIAPYRSPETKMFDDELVDNDGFWTAYYVNVYVLGWNTKLVKKEEVPRSYEALLDPKWKGGQISFDTEAAGMLEVLKKAWGADRAIAYFKRLAAQEPVLARGNTIRVQQVLAGEYPLILAYNQSIERFVARGAPIDWVALEPAVTQVVPVVLSANAAHPNAGRLFIDFVLSKDGQEMLRGFQRIPVRKDIEPDPPRLFRGFKRAIETPDDYRDFDATVKQYRQIFKQR